MARKSDVDRGGCTPGRVVNSRFFHRSRSVSIVSIGEGISRGPIAGGRPANGCLLISLFYDMSHRWAHLEMKCQTCVVAEVCGGSEHTLVRAFLLSKP